MKLRLSIVIIFFTPILLFGQKTDTLYYNKNWNECEKDIAVYYGIKNLDENKCGVERFFYITGQQHSYQNISYGNNHGLFTWWYKDGLKKCEGYYINGLKDSLWTYWYPSGKINTQGYFKDTIKENWRYWNEAGEEIYGINNFSSLDEQPLFKHTKNAEKSYNSFKKYINKKLKYPDESKEKGIEGKVVISFEVNEYGSIENIKIINGVDENLDQETIRVIENMPKWKPGRHSGKNVKVRITVPILFKLR